MSRADDGRSLQWDRGRDRSLDLVRGVAVLCMIVAHVRVWVPVDSLPVLVLLKFVNDVASPLFALVMGVSAGIVLTRASRRPTGGVFVLRNVLRGLLLVVIGVLLQQLGTFVAIVLQALGLTLIVAGPLALLPLPGVAGAAVLTFLGAPFVNAGARALLGTDRVHSALWHDQVLEWLVLSEHYRVTNLLPFVLAGVVLSRTGLTRRTVLATLATGMAAAVGMVLIRVAGVRPTVSGDLPDSVADLALAATAFGLIVLIGREVSGRLAWTLAPAQATGELALTSYVLHVGLIAVVMRTVTFTGPTSGVVWGTVVLVGTAAACWLWWRHLGRGPVERAMAGVTDRALPVPA